jgi:hypothetical protein
MSIISWYHTHNDIDANTSIYKKWNKISELLGTKPIKHIVYEYRNALWAFNWKYDFVLIYYDKRGIKIQVNEKIKKSEIKPLLDYLKETLINNI